MELGLNILVDISVLSILIFGFYQTQKGQLYSELFSLFGIILTTLVSLHYYVRLSEIITKRFLIPEDISQISVYVVLVIFLGFVLSIGCEGWVAVLKLEAHSRVDKWGGLLFGLVKFYLITGLIFLGLLISKG